MGLTINDVTALRWEKVKAFMTTITRDDGERGVKNCLTSFMDDLYASPEQLFYIKESQK